VVGAAEAAGDDVTKVEALGASGATGSRWPRPSSTMNTPRST